MLIKTVITPAMAEKAMKTPFAPRYSCNGRKLTPTRKFVSQFADSPSEPAAAALAGGTTSGMIRKGTGPVPMAKEQTKSTMKVLAAIAEEPIVKPRQREERQIRLDEVSRSARRPTRYKMTESLA